MQRAGTERSEEHADDDGSSSDGSSSGEEAAVDSSGDDEDEELLLLLEARLQTCGGRDYDAHAQLVRCLRDRGEMRKLEKARQAFSAVFPLTADMWLEWISDESRLAVTDEEHEKIVKLYERGVADYSMPRLWESYVQYSQKRYAEREDGDAAKPKLLNDARLVAERALACVGTHFTEGQRIWELQRSFEIGILEALGSEDNMQSLRVRHCFLTQIATPGRGTESAWEAYKSWEREAAMIDSVQHQFEKCASKNAGHEEQEKAVEASKDDPEALLAAWTAYIKFEDKQIALSRAMSSGSTAALLQRTASMHAARERESVRCLFERAALQCCLNPAVWQAYADWEKAGTEPSRTLQIFQRAVRNCPFSADLWVSYALFMEETADFSHAGGPDEDSKVEEVYVAGAKEVSYYSPATLRHLSLARCDFIRRRFLRHVPAGIAQSEAGDVEKERQVVRSQFEELAQVLSAQNDEAGARAVLIYLGELEALLFSKHPRAVQVWESALKGCADDADSWLSVAQVLRATRQVGQARALLKRGCNVLQIASKDQPKGISPAAMLAFVGRWVELERREGDVETYRVALAKYASLAHLSPAPSLSASGGGGAAQRKDKKTKAEGDSEDPAKAARREEVMKKWAERKAAAEGGVLPGNRNGDGNKSQDGKKRLREASDQGAAKKKAKTAAGNINATSGCSLFVQNLAPDVGDEALQQLFERFGAVAACRVVRNKAGDSKGFGYVDYAARDSLTAALAADGEGLELAGQRLEVSRARSLKADDKTKGGGPDRDLKTLFVSNLAPTVSRETLKTLFSSDAGPVVDVRMMRDREGHLRGFCYIEFDSDAGAQAGLVHDRSMLEGRQLRVALSDPSRSVASGSGDNAGRGRGRGGRGGALGGADASVDATVSRGRGRSMLQMPPRAAVTAMVPRSAARGGAAARGKPRPGLGSAAAGRGQGTGNAGDGADAAQNGSLQREGAQDKVPMVKDNNYFKELFASGGSL